MPTWVDYGPIRDYLRGDSWGLWNATASSQTTSVTAMSDTIWSNWQTVGTTTTGVTYTDLNYGGALTHVHMRVPVQRADRDGWFVEGADRVAVAEAVNADGYRRAQEALQRQEQAEARRLSMEVLRSAQAAGADVLKSLLTDEQWQSWVTTEAFEITTPAGNLYRLRNGVAGNVLKIVDGEITEALCCHPDTAVYDDDDDYVGDLPISDILVSQVLALRHQEDQFRRTANISYYRNDPRYAGNLAA